MTLQNILASSGGAILLFLTLVQIAPVKINPWSWLARTIGKAMNGDIMAKVEGIEHKLEQHIEADNERHADMRRQHILSFNDELIRGVHHSREHCYEVLHDIDEYERYCNEHPSYKNSRAALAIANIERVCAELQKTNGFIA